MALVLTTIAIIIIAHAEAGGQQVIAILASIWHAL
jgi:hypothetical protein